MGSTVGKDGSHLVEQGDTLENVADLLTKHVPRAVKVDFVVLSLCPACTEHIWNFTVQTVSECSEV